MKRINGLNTLAMACVVVATLVVAPWAAVAQPTEPPNGLDAQQADEDARRPPGAYPGFPQVHDATVRTPEGVVFIGSDIKAAKARCEAIQDPATGLPRAPGKWYEEWTKPPPPTMMGHDFKDPLTVQCRGASEVRGRHFSVPGLCRADVERLVQIIQADAGEMLVLTGVGYVDGTPITKDRHRRRLLEDAAIAEFFVTPEDVEQDKKGWKKKNRHNPYILRFLARQRVRSAMIELGIPIARARNIGEEISKEIGDENRGFDLTLAAKPQIPIRTAFCVAPPGVAGDDGKSAKAFELGLVLAGTVGSSETLGIYGGAHVRFFPAEETPLALALTIQVGGAAHNNDWEFEGGVSHFSTLMVEWLLCDDRDCGLGGGVMLAETDIGLDFKRRHRGAGPIAAFTWYPDGWFLRGAAGYWFWSRDPETDAEASDLGALDTGALTALGFVGVRFE